MNTTDAFLGAAAQTVELLSAPQVAAAWEQSSALAEMTVGALAGHLASQIFSVEAALREPESSLEPTPLLEHYARASWIDEPLDGYVNSGIRARGADFAADGPSALAARADKAVAGLRADLAQRSGGEVVFMPQVGRAMRLDDFLMTRLMELAVHMDDLAVSAALPTPQLDDGAFDPVLVLLARLAARRHGQAALLRALTRAERAPDAVNAF
jgi:hypothetical protein